MKATKNSHRDPVPVLLNQLITGASPQPEPNRTKRPQNRAPVRPDPSPRCTSIACIRDNDCVEVDLQDRSATSNDFKFLPKNKRDPGNFSQHRFRTLQDESIKIVCYYNSWSHYRSGNGRFLVEQIDPTLCTHLIYTFARVEDDGFTISSFDQYLEEDYGLRNFKRFNDLKNKSESLKTLIAVGGYADGSLKFSNMVAWKWRRNKFVKNIVQFVLKYGFDGVDLDWEFPGQRGGSPEDKQNFIRLLKRLREELNQYGLLLTVAVSAIKSTIDVSYDIPALVSYVDFINLMSYDYSGSWAYTTSHNSPLRTSTIATDNRLFLNVTPNYGEKKSFTGCNNKFFIKKSRPSSDDDFHQLSENPTLEVDTSTLGATEDPTTAMPSPSTSKTTENLDQNGEYDDLGLFDRSKLTDDEKMQLMKKHFCPDNKFTFSVR
ncbi:probable chitinase 2 [Limulus polyphemus]|uniref:Probable chitinase 2 n=1 Tax=Limulus polyphemus TaxID=6850 RepID=A0ABM1TNI9_LIMPO|nr:probable chitinase 2 [Limulus polyphemus]